MIDLNHSRNLAARPSVGRFAAMSLLAASDPARGSTVLKRFHSRHVRKLLRRFVLSGFLALAGAIPAQVANVTVTVSAPSTVMPSTGLGVGSSVYDNYLVDAAVPGNLKAAGVGMVRYPGGSYADIFHWQTTSTTTGQGGYIAANTDFVNWITQDVIAARASAIITVNYGSNPAGTGGANPSEAAAWVNYANLTKGYGVKYWEIGNEVYGNGYYNGSGWECDLHYNSTSGREGQDALSPVAYGSNVNLFVSAMKAVDPTIKVGAVLTTFGYWPDASQGASPDWNANVLQQCGANIDFVILHYYPDDGTGNGGTNIIAKTSEIPAIVSATRSLINTYCGDNASKVEIAVTEANGNTFANSYPAESLFAADLYCSWMENGAVTMDWQELHHTPPATFLVSASNGGPHRPWYGALMSRLLARPGDTFESATSDNPQVRVHATLRQDGQVGLLLINESATSSQSVNVAVNGPALTNTATQYQFGAANFAGNNPLPSSGVKTNTATGVGNSFTINVPSFTMTELLIPCGATIFYAANPSDGTVPLTVQFTAPNVDSGGNPVTYWNWAFGDGTTSTAQNPLHTYTTTGAFPTSLMATNTDGAAVLGIGPPIKVSPGFGLVRNGGFETGNFSFWTLSGDTSPWTFVDNGSASGIQPHSGACVAELGTTSARGFFSQTLSTVAGQTYLLSLWFNSPDGKTPNELLVSWNGNTLFDETNLPAFGWTNLQFVVTAAGTSTLLQFGFRDDPSYLALDDVSVVAVQPSFVGISLSGTNLVINANNGLSGQSYIVMMSTNLTLPPRQWMPVATNVLNTSGNFTLTATNAVDPNAPQRFYQMVLVP